MKIAFVGSGGKTTTIKRFARYYRQQGLKVFVTTTTHMKIEEDAILGDDAQKIIDKLLKDGYVFAGQRENEFRIHALSQETYQKVCQYADVVLVEADGSKRKPLKFPCFDYEPVIDEGIDEIIVLCGLSALSKPAIQVCHRFELAKEHLGIDENTLMSAQHIQRLLQEGYMKPLSEKYPNKKIRIYPNQMDTLYQRVVGRFLKENKDVSIIKEEWFESQPVLVICGAGHVGLQLATLAAYLDFEIVVIDDRIALANQERFPNTRVICDSFDRLERYFIDHAYYAIVAKSEQDHLQCLQTILPRPYGYIGMLGSHQKVQNIFDKLLQAGFSQEQIQTIHAPIGIDIHAHTPSEIAISILAQMIKEKNKHQKASASRDLLHTHKDGILCILIDKQGISPRDVGSMMFVTEYETFDSIGGGILESKVILDARKINHIETKDYIFESRRQTILFVPLFQETVDES